MSSIPISARAGARRPLRQPRRLLALARDERLVDQVRRGNDVAFEVAFERYGTAILAFCRHMLGSREEAEDAVQHTFASAYQQLLRDDREVALKPWLYTIARHRCVSMLRSRRDEDELGEVAIDGLSGHVERRAELRELLADVAALPAEQREALLLAETADLSHAEIAAVLGCEAQRVKALIYRARSSLIARRDARALPCEQIREQLATLRGGALRRTALVHHLKACPPCREYREQLKRQRRLLASALPVTPTAALKSAVLGGIGGAGGAGAGGVAVGGAASGLGAAGAAKIAAIAGVAVGGAVGIGTTVEKVTVDVPQRPPAHVAPPRAVSGASTPVPTPTATDRRQATGADDRRGPAMPSHAERPHSPEPARVAPGRDPTRLPPGHDPAHTSSGRDSAPGRDGTRLAPRSTSPRAAQPRPLAHARSGVEPAKGQARPQAVPPGRTRSSEPEKHATPANPPRTGSKAAPTQPPTAIPGAAPEDPSALRPHDAGHAASPNPVQQQLERRS